MAAGSEKQRTYSRSAASSKTAPPACRDVMRTRTQNSGSEPIKRSGIPLPAARKNQWK